MNFYCLLADAIAVLHFAFVAFIVGGMAAILAGIVLLTWVRNFYFSAIHLAMIAVVGRGIAASVGCPLTDWEDNLRLAGGQVAVEPNSFIGRLIHSLLFVNVSPSVLCFCYVGVRASRR